MSEPKVPFLTSFFRSQTASFVASAADFLMLVFLTEIVGFWYVSSTVLGGLTGAIVSFYLSRQWAFERTDDKKRWQIVRYALVSGTSLVLNTAGVYLLTEYMGSHYTISKLVISFLVGILFNFPMFRYFVFK